MQIFASNARESIRAYKQTGFGKPVKGSHAHSQMHVDVNICRLMDFPCSGIDRGDNKPAG